MKCEYNNCQQKANFTLYQLLPGLTKKWINVCSFHDRLIAQKNGELRKENPNKIWKEVN